MNGHLLACLEAIFAIKDPILNTVHQVALIREYQVVAGGTLQTLSRLIQVTIRDDERAY